MENVATLIVTQQQIFLVLAQLFAAESLKCADGKLLNEVIDMLVISNANQYAQIQKLQRQVETLSSRMI